MSRVATEVSSSLYWTNFEAIVDKEPLFVQYQNYQAQSFSASDYSWYIETPANGVLLDNEVWIHYYITITDLNEYIRSAWARTSDGTEHLSSNTNPENFTAFRCGNILQKACQSIAIDINGTVMTYEISKYHDVFNRIFVTKEESESVFPPGCHYFDDGQHLGLYENYRIGQDQVTIWGNMLGITGGAENPRLACNNFKGFSGSAAQTAILTQSYPEKSMNHGFYKRGADLEKLWREQNHDYTDNLSDNVGIARYPNIVRFEMFEKLSVSPFHMYDNRDIKMSIPNIRTLQITFQFHSNAAQLMMRTCGATVPNAPLGQNDINLNWYTIAPQLLLRWYTPPAGYSIPAEVTLPVTKIMTYTNSTLAGIEVPDPYDSSITYPITATGFSVSNISLPAVPDLLLVFFKRQLSQYLCKFPDDYNLSISRISIDMEGNSGKLNNCRTIHLWNMYRRHLRLYPASRDTFDNWFKYHCVLAITPADLGVIKGPGMDNPIQLSFRDIDTEYWFQVPSMNSIKNMDEGADNIYPSFNPENGIASAKFDFHVCAIYDKYGLTLTKDGSSALQLLRVNNAGTSTAPPVAVGPSSLADVNI